MKRSSLFRGDSAVLSGNFSNHNNQWKDYFVRCTTYSRHVRKPFYLHLGADAFLFSIIGFSGSIAVALVQVPGGYLADKHGRRWLIISLTFGLAI